jgi:hypothetical protein
LTLLAGFNKDDILLDIGVAGTSTTNTNADMIMRKTTRVISNFSMDLVKPRATYCSFARSRQFFGKVALNIMYLMLPSS